MSRLRRILPRGGTLPEPALRDRHRWLLALLWAHVPPLAAFTLIHGGNYQHGFEQIGVIVIVAACATVVRAHMRLSSALVALGLLTCSATLVHVSGGVIEMHFHFFVVFALLALYEDWVPFGIAGAYVLLHHGVLGMLEPESVYSHEDAVDHPWRWAGVHAMFLVPAAFASALAWRLNEGVRVQMGEANQRLRAGESERDLLSAIVSSSDDAIISKDCDGFITSWNPGAERLYGYSAREAIGKSIGDLIVPAHLMGDAQGVIAQVSTGDHVHHYETERRHKNGGIIDVSLTASPIQDGAGRLVGVSTIARDITERKQQELELAHDADDYGWLRRIRTALDEDMFVLFAQPVVDLRSGEATRAEVLLRMRGDRSQNDIISPGEFLGFAERFELVGEIDRWVLRNVMPLLRGTLTIEVNVSGASIGDLPLTDWLAEVIGDSNVDPSRLAIEVPQTAAIEDVQAAGLFSERLHELGCSLTLDDFGTGFGTFTYLKHMSVQHVKIDMQFTRDLVHSKADRQVVRSIVHVARDFGLATIGEGVENRETLDLLRNYGVDYAQGYFLGRPEKISLDQLPAFAQVERALR